MLGERRTLEQVDELFRQMSVREIREHLEELYQVEVTPSLISAVTDKVMEEDRKSVV